MEHCVGESLSLRGQSSLLLGRSPESSPDKYGVVSLVGALNNNDALLLLRTEPPLFLGVAKLYFWHLEQTAILLDTWETFATQEGPAESAIFPLGRQHFCCTCSSCHHRYLVDG
mmetsp:Transcript_46573/g.69314  ORF Transcript_46573/g.69314 Transcript_46573/m.69314 type:complete len:114 (-) Transcript_46573:11-352(-)